jgi:ABC transporter with metal-binding/Fe-S-binding domain ATP-binding protein
MKLAALFSGGKDSTFAVMEAIKAGHEVKALITVAPLRDDSYMFHFPCIDLTRVQANLMGIRQVWVETEGQKEAELVELRQAIESVRGEVDGVVSGAVSSRYQKDRIDGICRQLGLESYAPLWGRDPYDLLKEETEQMEVVVSAVATAGLGKGWLGRRINTLAIEELRAAAKKTPFNIQFEGGEGETFVTDCPLFCKKIFIDELEKVWDSRTSSGHIVVKKHSFSPKKI